jgi:hypothetical protein
MFSMISLAYRRSQLHYVEKNADCMVILHVAKSSANEIPKYGHMMRPTNESAR